MPDTIRIILSKAVAHHRTVPNLLVEATVDIDTDLGATLSNNTDRLFYESQARSLITAFTRTLPGGLIDAILVALLGHRVGVLRVPYAAVEPKPDRRDWPHLAKWSKQPDGSYFAVAELGHMIHAASSDCIRLAIEKSANVCMEFNGQRYIFCPWEIIEQSKVRTEGKGD